MVENLSQFTTVVLYTTIVTMIIKMIAPEGKNKKYILFISGTIVTLILLEPLLEMIHIDVNEVFANNEISSEGRSVDEKLYQDAIYESYEKTLIQDIIHRLEENGYKVKNVQVEYNKETYQPTKVYIKIEDSSGYVQPVKIEVSNTIAKNKVSEITKSKIQEIIHECYGVEKSNVMIEGSI